MAQSALLCGLMAQSAAVVEHATPFWVDPSDDVPVGLQLAWRLRALIATGRLLPGDRLPSVRTLADWSGVNVNTVRAVYAKLEDERASYQRELAPESPPSGRGAHAHVAGVEELERTRDALLRHLAEARAEAVRAGERQRGARARLDAMVADPAGRKWDSVTSAELGEPGCATYSVVPAAGPLGALMRWWRVKVSSGCP